MSGFSQETINYAAYAVFNVLVAREVNNVVTEPYMDEPFHIPQAQAYCRSEWNVWDPKITTPPGLYLVSVALKRIFVFKCTLQILRLTNVLLLLALPPIISHLLALRRRFPPPQSIIEPTLESIMVSSFPITWFFAFLYYTEVGSLVFVLATLLLSLKGRHWSAALAGFASCTFRQTNIIWVGYALAFSSIRILHHRSLTSGPAESSSGSKLFNPPARSATVFDIFRSLLSLPRAVAPLALNFVPYIILFSTFAAFVIWNGGIVLGDKSNHVPQLHVPQLYYFIGFTTAMGLPILLSGPGGPSYLAGSVYRRMLGGAKQTLTTVLLSAIIAVTVHKFTIHHPFLLSDNRHYTFYVWNRLFRRHPMVAYLLSPAYLACYHAWFVRIYIPPATSSNSDGVSSDSEAGSLLESLLVPLCLLPTLLPTPLLEPRYFLIPYLLLRLQIGAERRERKGVFDWSLLLEGMWYALINWATMSMFLYKPREGVGRFMW